MVCVDKQVFICVLECHSKGCFLAGATVCMTCPNGTYFQLPGTLPRIHDLTFLLSNML